MQKTKDGADILSSVIELSNSLNIDKKRSLEEVCVELDLNIQDAKELENLTAKIDTELRLRNIDGYSNNDVNLLKMVKKFLFEENLSEDEIRLRILNVNAPNYCEEGDDKLLNSDDLIQNFNEQNLLKSSKDKDGSQFINVNEKKSIKENTKNIVAKTKAININKELEVSMTKEQKNEILSVVKNITKNLGNLKMLLRS